MKRRLVDAGQVTMASSVINSKSAALCTICNAHLGQLEEEALNLKLENDNTLSKGLEVFFVLRNVLRLPCSLMEELLVTSGGCSLTEWGLQFCGVCRRMIQEAGFLFSRIRKLVEEYEQVGQGLRERVKVGESGDMHLEGSIRGMSRTRGRGGERQRKEQGNITKGGVAEGDLDKYDILGRIKQSFMKFMKESDSGVSPIRRGLASSSISKSSPKRTINSYCAIRFENIEESPILKKNSGSVPVNGRGKGAMGRLSQEKVVPLESGLHIPSISDANDDDVKVEVEDEQEYLNEDFEVHYEPTFDESMEDNSDYGADTTVCTAESHPEDDTTTAPRRFLRPRKTKKVMDSEDDGSAGENDDEDDEDDFHINANNSNDESEDPEEEDSDYRTETPNSLVTPKNWISNKRKSNNTIRSANPNNNSTKKNKVLQCCQYCPFSCKAGFSLDAHILIAHKKIPRPFECDLCFKVFNKLANVMLHIDLRHNSETKNEIVPDEIGQDTETSEESELFKSLFSVEESKVIDDSKIADIVEVNSDTKSFEAKEENSMDESLVSKQIPKKPRKRYRKTEGFPHQCNQCSYRFKLNWVLNSHILRSHYGDKRSYECDECPRRFARKVMLYAHRTARHPRTVTPYEGPRTSLESRIAELNLKKPQIILGADVCKNKKVFTCVKCDLKFMSRITSEVHLRRVHQGPETKLKCPDCELYFLSVTGRKMHYEQFHIKQLGKHRSLFCAECNQKFKRQYDFDRHLKSHHKKLEQAKECMCELCSLIFSDMNNLAAHQRRIHPEELGLNPYKCQYCSKNLNTKRNLEAHIVSAHTKEYPYQCPYCTKGFALETQIKVHVRNMHTKDKPWKCEHCDRAFTFRFNLNNHLRVHTGEKPYKCKQCGKDYSDYPTFKRHLETHGTKIHTCPTCQREFKVWHSFRLHCMTHDKSLKRKKPVARRTQRNKEEDNSTSEEEHSNSNFATNDLPQNESNSNPDMPSEVQYQYAGAMQF